MSSRRNLPKSRAFRLFDAPVFGYSVGSYRVPDASTSPPSRGNNGIRFFRAKNLAKPHCARRKLNRHFFQSNQAESGRH